MHSSNMQISKEMQNIGIVFEILDHDHNVTVGWHEVTGHMVFGANIDFTNKARWVLDGHRTLNP